MCQSKTVLDWTASVWFVVAGSLCQKSNSWFVSLSKTGKILVLFLALHSSICWFFQFSTQDSVAATHQHAGVCSPATTRRFIALFYGAVREISSSSPGRCDQSENAFTLTLLTAPEVPQRRVTKTWRHWKCDVFSSCFWTMWKMSSWVHVGQEEDRFRSTTTLDRKDEIYHFFMWTDRSRTGTMGPRGQGVLVFLSPWHILSK